MDFFGLQINAGALVGKAVMLAVAVVVALVVQRVVVRLMHRVLDASSLPSASIFINIVRVLIWVLALLSVLQPVFGVDPAGFVTALGVVSLAISLGMQDTISNIVSGISLMVSKAVQPGDQVTVGGVTGEVTDVNWRSTTVRTRGGSVQVIPNSVLSSTALTHEIDWTVGCCKVPLAVVPGADLDAVAAEVRATVARVLAGELDPAFETGVVFTSFTAYGVQGEVQIHVLPEVVFSTAQDKVVRALSGASWLASAL
ncbi:mechanosensitive ion channel family protein [Olsenella profusa]|uniref:Mechanosensitive ion channel n=1 Tax=Olsenella profusa TaxID=138595 RepID=A0ABS2F3C2_9ACTN|nr:mechanosensitive ion channel domain-containing protein [Olsenella profusa]MBM6775038.1 mechanosensitive ion channel [Olsenella profusa]